MTKLSFYNGLQSIGGTFVAVETDKAICMFDFGFAVSGGNDDAVNKRESFAADYVRLGMLTPFDGIYDDKTAKLCSLKPYGAIDKKVFFVISHMHIDHMGGLGSLADDVPVYMSMESYRLYKNLVLTGDIQDKKHDNCIGIEYGCSFEVEDITVDVLPIDHDCIGACGFLIKTNDGSVCYTGDYRFHGFHPDITEAFAKKCHNADVMITEGVTASFDDVDMLSLEEPTDMRTEYDLVQEMDVLFKLRDGLVVVNPYNRNVERIHNLINTCNKNGKTLVLDGMLACYVEEFYKEDRFLVYSEALRGVKPHKGWSLIGREELLANPSDYVLQNDYSNIYELIELKDKISHYVHMDGVPLGDYSPSYAKMFEFLEAVKLTDKYMRAGLGGHAKPYYLCHMIDTIAPKTLIPLHSFRPEQVQGHNNGVRILPQYGEVFELSNGQLTKLN